MSGRWRSGTAATTRPRSSRSHPEDDLQQAVVSFHASAVRQADAVLYAVPNGEKRDPVTAARLSGLSAAAREDLDDAVCLMPAGLGVLPGVADLHVLIAGGRLLLVELKIAEVRAAPASLPLFAAGGRSRKPAVLHRAGSQSKSQKRFEAGAAALGHTYRVIRSVEGYADLLEEFGVRLRCRPWGPGVASPRPPIGFKP